MIGKDNPKKILFLCTGNYYRSRLAEEIFNHYSSRKGLEYIADSKGLAKHIKKLGNKGPIASYATDSLRTIGVHGQRLYAYPSTVRNKDMKSAELIVALHQEEHEPIIKKMFPQYNNKIIYWNVSDVGVMPAQEATSIIRKNVLELIKTLAVCRRRNW